VEKVAHFKMVKKGDIMPIHQCPKCNNGILILFKTVKMSNIISLSYICNSCEQITRKRDCIKQGSKDEKTSDSEDKTKDGDEVPTL